MSLFNYKLYLVTDEKACRGRNLFQVVEEALKGGVDIVQLREKNLCNEDFLAKAQKLKELLDKYNTPLIINDNVPVAVQTNSDGIHVGKNDLQPIIIKKQWPFCKILGYSVEDESQLQTQDASVADYLALSPIFFSATKMDTATRWGLEGIKRARSVTSKPLVAIGDVNASNAKSIIDAGADCLAVVSAICSAENPAKAAEAIRNEIEKTGRTI